MIAARNISQNNVPELGIVAHSQTVLFFNVMVPLRDSACFFICMLNYLQAAGSSNIQTVPKDIPSARQWVIFFIYEQEIIGFFMFCFTFFSETKVKECHNG